MLYSFQNRAWVISAFSQIIIVHIYLKPLYIFSYLYYTFQDHYVRHSKHFNKTIFELGRVWGSFSNSCYNLQANPSVFKYANGFFALKTFVQQSHKPIKIVLFLLLVNLK